MASTRSSSSSSSSGLFTSGLWNVKALSSLSNIEPHVQQHLRTVYTLLAATVGAGALGTYVQTQYGVGGQWGWLVALLLTVYVTVTNAAPGNLTPRAAALLGVGLSMGASLGPMVSVLNLQDDRLVLHALLGTTTVFICFSAAALFAERRAWLFLGGLLSSAMAFLALTALVALVAPSQALFDLRLYLGLLVFATFVVFDTQLIVERASLGELDAVKHALTLFLDFANLLVRIMALLSKKSNNKKNDRR